MALTQVRTAGLEDGAYGMVFVSTTTLSSAAGNMNITLNASDYDFYKLIGIMQTDTDANKIVHRFLDSSGTVVSASGSYHNIRSRFFGSDSHAVSSSTTNMEMMQTMGTSTNENGLSFEMLIGPTNTNSFPTQYHSTAFYHNNGSTPEGVFAAGGFVVASSSFGGISFIADSGNLTTICKVTAYGMKT